MHILIKINALDIYIFVGLLCRLFIKSMFVCKPYSDTSQDDDEDDDLSFEHVRSFKGVAQSYELNFASGIRNLHPRMEAAVCAAAEQLTKLQRNGRSMKYYLSLRCNFYKPSDPDTITDEPCSFNSGTSTLLPTSSIKTQMEINYISILQAVEDFEKNGSGMGHLFLPGWKLQIISPNSVLKGAHQ